MSQRRRDIPAVTRDRHQKQEQFPIGGKPRMRALQRRQGLGGCTGRIESYRVDVSVTGIVRRKFAGVAQFGQRLGVFALPHQKQPQSVMRFGIVRLGPQRLPQQTGPILIPPACPLEIREIDQGRDEVRL